MTCGLLLSPWNPSRLYGDGSTFTWPVKFVKSPVAKSVYLPQAIELARVGWRFSKVEVIRDDLEWRDHRRPIWRRHPLRQVCTSDSFFISVRTQAPYAGGVTP